MTVVLKREGDVLINTRCVKQLTEAGCDEELVLRIAKGDEGALMHVIELYAGQVKSICKRICADELEADGVVSVVFWELWNGIAKYDPKRGSLRTYLLTLARSRAIDWQRAASARDKNNKEFFFASSQRPMAGTLTMNEVANAQENAERTAELRRAIELLPDQQKSALELAFFDGLTHREVAERQSLPLGTIKTNIRRGLLQLRKILIEDTEQTRELA